MPLLMCSVHSRCVTARSQLLAGGKPAAMPWCDGAGPGIMLLILVLFFQAGNWLKHGRDVHNSVASTLDRP